MYAEGGGPEPIYQKRELSSGARETFGASPPSLLQGSPQGPGSGTGETDVTWDGTGQVGVLGAPSSAPTHLWDSMQGDTETRLAGGPGGTQRASRNTTTMGQMAAQERLGVPGTRTTQGLSCARNDVQNMEMCNKRWEWGTSPGRPVWIGKGRH